MKKNFKMMLELIAKKETEEGAIPLLESVKIIKDFGKLAKKLNLDCYVRGHPRQILDYKPTNKEYKIKTIDDIVEQLTLDQFEMFIEDLRSYINIHKSTQIINEFMGTEVMKNNGDGMTWLDTGKFEIKTELHVQTSNKL